MFVNVIILRNAQNIDQMYTYKVPQKYQNERLIGKRVLVPFGASGQVEGIVLECHETLAEEPKFKIKPIHYVFDDDVFLSENDLLTVQFIRAQYLSSYTEAIQLFLPSGTMTQQLKRYRATALGFEHLQELSKNERLVFSQIQSMDLIEENQIEFDASERLKLNTLKKLASLNYIEMIFDYVETVKDRTIDRVHVIGDIQTYQMSIPVAHKAKHKLCSVLLEHDVIEKKKLLKDFKITGSVIKKFLEDDMIEIKQVEDLRIPTFMSAIDSKKDIKLNSEQQEIFEQILSNYDEKKCFDFLIYGITGSGKTEVYAELIEEMIKRGKQTILVVPEISLTPQIVSRFVSRFGKNRVALLHSKISLGEKHDQWKGIRRGDYDIIIGARSAVFAPSDEIGLIIIDEEHENSFRSEKRPRYDTYEIAKERMKHHGGFIVSGSATPSIVSYYQTTQRERMLLKLMNRHNNLRLPAIEIVDMRRELSDGNMSILSRKLYEAIEDRLAKKEQSIIFLNRKGHSTFVSCRSCGYTMSCPNCEVTLTFFKSERSVKCNYCGYESYVPKKCPSCESQYFKYFGVGTEKVEETLRSYFKDAVIARMDRTTTTKKGTLETLINDVETEKTDILIGTQMVAKGFDFKNVTLVGVLSADLLFNLPSYQAAERTYQLVNQVAGRSGRGGKEGEVILQTYTPDHYAINISDYEAFYDVELGYRKAMHYPPFYQLINILITSKTEETANKYAQKAHAFLSKNFLKKDLQNTVELYDASPALLKKIDGLYRWQILMKCPPNKLTALMRYFKILEDEFIKIDDCSINIDLNARHIL